MATYKELLAQQQELERLITEARTQEVAAAVAQARQLIADYGLTAEDVFPPGKKSKGGSLAGSTVAAKYRDPESGLTWTGRGKPPTWIKDKNRDDFLI